MQSFISSLNREIAKMPLLKHSFYVRWQEGKVSLSELQGYAKEYYPFEKEFPCFVSAIHSRSENTELRHALLQNLIHEENGPMNHRELWLQFAEGLGVRREDAEAHFRSDETEHLLRVFRKAANSGNPIDGLSALYAYEAQQPEVAATKIDGLIRHYDVTSDSALKFFRAHQVYDVEHSATEGKLLESLCRDEASKQRAIQAVEDTCRALYEFLDGVERRYFKAA
jgi:pyrroloquinoline-quinone synthase